ncbi:MAG: glycosyltransferase family A protein [Terriglobales bacterium]|jgi:glycosyltransferase involved in cell wall biosynthesis
MPIVSVIIPNYNHARFLRRRIDSVLGQTFRDFELILLDDCSTDDSRLILSQYRSDPRVRIEFNVANSGSPFKQWNKGVELARGEYVWIAESDDYADQRLLEKLTARLDAEPRAAFAYCRSWRVSLDEQVDGFVDPWIVGADEQHRWTADYCADGHAECRNYMVRLNTVPNASAVVFRRAVYQRVGGADETLCLCGDWKLWAALALTGKVVYFAEPLNCHRFHDASVSSMTNRSGMDIAESFPVRWWILDQVTRRESYASDALEKRALANSCMDLAFESYPDSAEITRLALQRSQELGGTEYIPPFGTWRGELLKRVIGWKATKRANIRYHRYSSWARNAICRERTAR